MINLNNKKNAMTLIELIIVMGIMVLLTGSIYQIFRSVSKSFAQSQNKLDILQTTRIIMSGLRNELRNAVDKPQTFNGRLNIPLSATRTVQYYYDENSRRIYKGEKGSINDPDPDLSEMKTFLFDDGQILAFDFDFSYRDSNSFVESELTLNAKVWCKVSMKILYSQKFNQLSEEDKAAILAKPDDDPRVKSFFMVITPRKVNWLLQATQ
jgi:prepilin-type N-terminal cleavage/methylation domain-containing protein